MFTTSAKGQVLIVLLVILSAACRDQARIIVGVVESEAVPIAGARVRWQTDEVFVSTDEAGAFQIPWTNPGKQIRLTAWSPGYFISASDPISPEDSPITITLKRHGGEDNPEYKWVSALASGGQEGNCQNCHSDHSGRLPFEEWQADAHSRTLRNHRFITLYLGTNLVGDSSPPTRYAQTRDYGPLPLPPNPNFPYFGPGYKLDFPEIEGNCAACHAPAAAINAPYDTNPLKGTGAAAEGIGCDFCHKIWDVRLADETGLPHPNMPGVLSFEFRRPADGHQFFAGPFDDVAPGEDTYSPIQAESAYCAPCHFGVFWDTTIYNSYGEWLESPYSDPVEGQTCQDCHMPARGATQFATTEEGGLSRNPARIASHLMLGINDQAFMAEAVSLEADSRRAGQEIYVTVAVTNDNTGHKIPTDSPLRNLILLVQGTDEGGAPLELVAGPRLPGWAGEDAGRDGHYGDQPGRMFALQLRERWTGISPTAAYWNPVQVVSDTRLAPFERDESFYTFRAPEEGPAVIEVKLIFRRAFIELAEQKGWGVEDLMLHSLTLQLR